MPLSTSGSIWLCSANCSPFVAFQARKTSRATLSLAFAPLGGYIWWPLRKSLEKGTEVTVEKVKDLDTSEQRKRLLAKFWATKAFLIYLGLPENKNTIYASFEPSRLILKALYGCAPEDDLTKMKPSAELKGKLKAIKNVKVDLRELNIPLLVLLWHAYYCWDLLYWDVIGNALTSQCHKEKKAAEKLKQHAVSISKDWSEKDPNIRPLDSLSIEFEQLVKRSQASEYDCMEFLKCGMSREARQFCIDHSFSWYSKVKGVFSRCLCYFKDEKPLAYAIFCSSEDSLLLSLSRFYGPGRQIYRKIRPKDLRIAVTLFKGCHNTMEKHRSKAKSMVHVIERIGAVSGEEGEEACKKLLTAISTRTAVPTIFIVSKANEKLSNMLAELGGWSIVETVKMDFGKDLGDCSILQVWRHEADLNVS